MTNNYRYVIFKENGKYKMTSEDNYKARIRNANQVITCNDCNSFEEAVSCFPNYQYIEYVDMTGD